MNEAISCQYYTVLQLAGFAVQIFPVLFLLFSPYRPEELRVGKKKLLGILSLSAAAVCVFGALTLGSLYAQGNYELAARLWGNLIFGVYLIAGTLVYFLVLKNGLRSGLLTYLLAMHYAVFLYIVVEIADKFFPLSLPPYRVDPYTPGTVVMYAAATALSWPFVCRFLRRNGPERFRNVNRRSILLITVSSVIMLAATIFSLQLEVVLDTLQTQRDSRVYLSLWLVCMLVIGFLAYLIYFRCLQIEEEKADINMRLAAEEMQYTALDRQIQEDRKMSHNMRHHFRTLTALAESEQYGELQEYLKRYLKEWENISSRNICRNPMMNSILVYYFSQAEKQKVQIEADLQIGAHYPFNNTDMTVLLGNALENALEACAETETEKPFIRVMMKQFRKSFLIQIENSCRRDGSSMEGTGRLRSTKKGRSRGYGIASMEMIVRKYQGSLDYWREDRCFILRAVLNIPGEGAGWYGREEQE